jgi:hypothetical protein
MRFILSRRYDSGYLSIASLSAASDRCISRLERLVARALIGGPRHNCGNMFSSVTVMMGIPVLGSSVLPTIKGSVPVCGWATIRNELKGKHRISGKKDFNRRRTFCATKIDKTYLPVLVVVVMMILPELVSILEADFELDVRVCTLF